jgi:hypothetical protein
MADAVVQPKPAGAQTADYRVLQNLRHNGKHYSAGKTVRLTKKEAKPLVERKVVASPSASDDQD